MSEENTLELAETLRGLDFFRDVPEQHVDEIAKLAKFVDFSQGTIVFSTGEPALHSYVIVEGSVLLEICGPTGCKRILTIGEGQLLGCSPLLGQSELTASAQTLAPTRAIELSGPEVVQLCKRVPEIGYQVMRCTALAMARRLTATRLQLLDLYSEQDGDKR